MAQDVVGQRIAELYQDLSFPSANRLQSALRKEGVTISLSGLRDLVAESGARQVFQPPPRYEGKIAATRLDDRWAADLLSFESSPAKRAKATFRHVLVVQDIFSRYLWAEPLSSKLQVRAAFERILALGRKPRELSTDKGTEFSSRDFQALLTQRGIHWRSKVGLNDLATIDRAMSSLSAAIGRRGADESTGGDWLANLEPAVASFNRLDHSALFDNAPGEVMGNDDLRFQLRQENASKMMHNQEHAAARKRKLETQGAFRTLLRPTAFKRRAGQQNWSTEVHPVQEVEGGQVTDTLGATFPTRLVFAAPLSSSAARPTRLVAGGSTVRDARQRDATERFLPELVAMVRRRGNKGITMALAGREMAQKPGFKAALREQRMNFARFVQVHGPTFRVVKAGNATRLFLATAPAPPTGPLDTYAAAPEFRRLRRLRL